MSSDLGVEVQGDSLGGRNVLLVVSGGIAAVESVKLSREIRRHGANLSIIMTKDANKVITPLALSWASATPCLLYTSPSPRDGLLSRMPSSA